MRRLGRVGRVVTLVLAIAPGPEIGAAASAGVGASAGVATAGRIAAPARGERVRRVQGARRGHRARRGRGIGHAPAARHASAAEHAARRPTAVVTSIQAGPGSQGAGTSVVTIEAEGQLPVPLVGVLDGPPRIYLDLAGAVLGPAASAPTTAAGIRGIRASLRRRRPPMVRIVIDLEAPVAHRVDDRGRAAGRIAVLVGAGALTPESAVPTAAPAATRASSANGAPSPPVSSVRPPGSAPGRTRDADRYVQKILPVLTRLHVLRQGVASIATGPVAIPPGLDAMAAELDDLGRSLGALKAPPSVATPHELLLRFCAIGARAARMRTAPGADAGAVQNAASAAAGALIMLDRASSDLGYAPPQ